jgi:hypothetical protein
MAIFLLASHVLLYFLTDVFTLAQCFGFYDPKFRKVENIKHGKMGWARLARYFLRAGLRF